MYYVSYVFSVHEKTSQVALPFFDANLAAWASFRYEALDKLRLRHGAWAASQRSPSRSLERFDRKFGFDDSNREDKAIEPVMKADLAVVTLVWHSHPGDADSGS